MAANTGVARSGNRTSWGALHALCNAPRLALHERYSFTGGFTGFTRVHMVAGFTGFTARVHRVHRRVHRINRVHIGCVHGHIAPSLLGLSALHVHYSVTGLTGDRGP